MGRRAYDMGQGDFTGYEFQVPIFVLSHDVPREVAKGENERLTFTFVTDGIDRAVELAKAAAGDKDVVVIGGASTAQQGLRAGLFDEIEIDVAPILLGEGLRLFENIGAELIELERIRVLADDWFIHLRFRVVKQDADPYPREELIGILMSQRVMDSPTCPAYIADFWASLYQAIDD